MGVTFFYLKNIALLILLFEKRRYNTCWRNVKSFQRTISKTEELGVVSSNATAIARDAPSAWRGRSCGSSRARFSCFGAVPGYATPWPSEVDAPPPVWIIYSGCIPGNFRGAVLRWLRSFIAGSPPSTTRLPLSSSASTFARTSQLPLPLARPRPLRGHFSGARGTSSFRAARCAALSALICAQRERRETNARCARREGVRRIFVFAHSRANAHPSSGGGTLRRGWEGEREKERAEDCPPSCSTGTRAAFSSRKTPDRARVSDRNIVVSLSFHRVIFCVKRHIHLISNHLQELRKSKIYRFE